MPPSFIADARADKGDDKKKRGYCMKTTSRCKTCDRGAVFLYLSRRFKDSAAMDAACATGNGA
ncbi:MAG: hypothetical protein ACJAWY_000770 [Sphingomonas echinoides]|jgi:hypothetical protein